MTQKEAAVKGIITKEMEACATYEGVTPEKVREEVAKGHAVIPCNVLHKSIKPRVIGNKFKTKINVNLGISKDSSCYDAEMDKVKCAVDMNADAIMDLSSYGDTTGFRRELIDTCPAMIGTVPVYDAVIHFNKDLKDITSGDFIEVVKNHVKDGVDFITVHCGITRRTMDRLEQQSRLTNIVSRGGALIFAWMKMTGQENPFYERYDEILDICREYDVTISLGDGCRPGSINDATDLCQIDELVTLGELTNRAMARDVQVMVEGPGHMRLNEIEANMTVQQRLCSGAPFYVLGPLVTDVAPGYDHITSAIGGAIAASHGAAFLCYVTPAEHLRLPDLDDMKEGIIASKIAAHAADLSKGISGAAKWDYDMSKARQELDFDKMFELAIDGGVKGRKYRETSPNEENTCSMCGKFCSIRNMNKALKGETVDIL